MCTAAVLTPSQRKKHLHQHPPWLPCNCNKLCCLWMERYPESNVHRTPKRPHNQDFRIGKHHNSNIFYTETSTKHRKIICNAKNFKSLEQTKKETNAAVERRCIMLVRYVSQSLNLPMQTTLSTSSADKDGPEHTVLINQRMQRRAHGQI